MMARLACLGAVTMLMACGWVEDAPGVFQYVAHWQNAPFPCISLRLASEPVSVELRVQEERQVCMYNAQIA